MDTPNRGDFVFALDIGTRTVIGVVCRKEGNTLKIAAESMMEHDSRSMIDGQVHDVERVTEVVVKVKEELEQKLGFTLKEVAIAAAGRTLKTKCVHIEQDLGDDVDIDSAVVSGLELSGVGEASRQIKEESREGKDHFYCVGYSIVSYYLNGYSISNLMSHRGRFIGADVLATFLPQSVVNSLYRVLEKSGLTAVSLTLEPIAAMEAVVPDNIRLLNIALIDIGAGTSDIAITKRGAIVAYSMVPVAGDEITEAIAEEYLLDFNTAEQIKRNLGKKKKISFKDIMGIKRSVDAKEIMEIIKNAGLRIAGEISKAIIQHNGDAPKAVFCVGGGSRTPYLMEELSKELNIEKQRIAVKNRESVLNLDKCGRIMDGPEGVTVIGIAIIAMKKVGHNFINVYVNGKECRVFNSRDLNIRDVLGLIGYNPSSIIGRSGRSLKFTLNGVQRRISGESPVPPEIKMNNIPANLDSMVNNGDYISIKDAVDGKDAASSVKEQCQKHGIELAGRSITVNGNTADADYMINDGDDIRVEHEDGNAVSEVQVDSTSESIILRNTDQNIIMENKDTTTVNVNGSKVVLNSKVPIFVDIFNVIDFDLSKPKGTIKLRLNDRDAEYSEVLNDGDVIEVYWENSLSGK